MSKGRIIFGIILIVIGGLFILERFHFFHYYNLHNFWPLILIIIGIALIIRHATRSPKAIEHNQNVNIEPGIKYRKHSQVFGDNTINAKDSDIDGLNCSAVFGDNTINLAEAKLKPGINTIELSGVFGTITVIVPGNMEVRAHGSSTFGDLYILGQTASGISNSLQHQTENYDTAAAKVSIMASVTFGDIKIYRA